jgi:DNA-binding MarR family transcriptional regulator
MKRSIFEHSKDGMDSDSYRDLQVLIEISTESSITQRRLAKKQGLALGLTNFLVRRLVRKGHIKVVNLQHNRIRYLITPKGLMEKARLTYAYIEYSLYFYRQIRGFLTRALAMIPPSAGKKIVLCGTGEVAEIACLLLQQNGFNLVAVVESQAGSDAMFLGQPVRSLKELSALSFDWVIVTSLRDRDQMKQHLDQQGVPEAKVIAIPDEGTPTFHTQTLPLLETPLLGERPLEVSK